MDILEIKPEEDCQEQCGAIYITSSGILVIHCNLCENKCGYEDFPAHIEEHITPDIYSKGLIDEIVDTDNSDIISSDEMYATTSSMPEHQEMELTPEEGENIFELDSEKDTDKIDFTNEGSNLENFVKFERLDDEEFAEEIEKKLPINVSTKVITSIDIDPILKSEKKVLSQRKAERIHKCIYCDFSCNDRSNLLGHIKRHSNHKPHKCTECSKCFYTRTELKAHIRSHTGERPYLCTECGKAFATSSKLSLHLKRHANIRDKECPMCDMKFYNTTRLRDHMMIHSEDRPLKCDMCEASFKAYSSLKNHRKLHENERKYKCTLCSASFNQNPGLYSHMKKRHSVVKSVESTEKEFKPEAEES